MPFEYKVISDRYVEHLVEELNKHAEDGWEVTAYLQEFGLTKFVLQRERTKN